MGATEQLNQHSKELKINLNDSLKLTLSILLALYIINLLRAPKKNSVSLKKIKTKNYWGEFYFRHLSILYQEHTTVVLERENLPSDYIESIIQDLENNIYNYNQDILNDVLNELEIDIKNDIKNDFIIENSLSDDSVDIYSKVMDFLFEYQHVMIEVLECIESGNSKNKSSMLYMTTSSFARTLASYVEDCSKPLIREIVKLSSLKFIRLLRNRKNVATELDENIKSISKQGMGDLNFLLKINLDFSSKINPTIYNKHKNGINTFKKFVESRNRIIHNFNCHKKDINFIINNWKPCLDFYSDILTEFTQTEGLEIFFNTLYEEATKCARNQDLMTKNVLPLIDTYM